MTSIYKYIYQIPGSTQKNSKKNIFRFNNLQKFIFHNLHSERDYFFQTKINVFYRQERDSSIN